MYTAPIDICCHFCCKIIKKKKKNPDPSFWNHLNFPSSPNFSVHVQTALPCECLVSPRCTKYPCKVIFSSFQKHFNFVSCTNGNRVKVVVSGPMVNSFGNSLDIQFLNCLAAYRPGRENNLVLQEFHYVFSITWLVQHSFFNL